MVAEHVIAALALTFCVGFLCGELGRVAIDAIRRPRPRRWSDSHDRGRFW